MSDTIFFATPPAPRAPTSPEAYIEQGLGTLPDDIECRSMYLDLMKRAVANILYEDIPSWILNREEKTIRAAEHFELESRVNGPTAAHAMIGRLQIVKNPPDEDEPSGDLVDYVMQGLRQGDRMAIPTRDTSLEGVRSNFARYGLVDDPVVFWRES